MHSNSRVYFRLLLFISLSSSISSAVELWWGVRWSWHQYIHIYLLHTTSTTSWHINNIMWAFTHSFYCCCCVIPIVFFSCPISSILYCWPSSAPCIIDIRYQLSVTAAVLSEYEYYEGLFLIGIYVVRGCWAASSGGYRSDNILVLLWVQSNCHQCYQQL